MKPTLYLFLGASYYSLPSDYDHPVKADTKIDESDLATLRKNVKKYGKKFGNDGKGNSIKIKL